MKTVQIDAAGKILGRVATTAAHILLGKDEPTFARNVVADVKVEILNADQIKLPVQRLQGSTFKRYSGYPGGLKVITLGKMKDSKGMTEVLHLTVKGMLPNNKLKKDRLKNLVVHA
jgi:large subunit ribosomal protein L13